MKSGQRLRAEVHFLFVEQVVCDTSVWAVIGGQDVDRLPSASTCYNTLKVMSLMSFVPSNNVHAHRNLITVHLKVQDGTFRMVELWGILLCLLHHQANSPLHTSTDKISTVLQLPTYKRMVTLREKLRYAIKSNTGFELS
jgi:hypothetical protein